MIRYAAIKFVQTVVPLFLLLLVSDIPPMHAEAPHGGPSQMNGDFRQDIESFQQNMRAKMQETMRNQNRRKMQDKMSGLPESVLAAQSQEPVQIPSLEQAVILAGKAASEAVQPLIDTKFHERGKTILVPGDYASIQEAIQAAESGDTVVVSAGTYYEQLVMKDGVRLVSEASNGGDKLMTVADAHLQLPQRTLRTIIDGSKSTPSKHGMVDFDPGVGRNTIIDGFTIQNLPLQNHHMPGHAHGLNVRGASPVIMNCLIQNMGSTGIGSHVVYNDQDSKMTDRDFRWENIRYQASAVIYNNIIHDSVGLGIGCNHFSSPIILGNEVFSNNDAVLGEPPTPGIGNKHGSFATIIGNIVHDNPGGGIMAKEGARQGMYPINRPTHPTIKANVIYGNGEEKPGISAMTAGSDEMPVVISGNYVYRATAVGIGLIKNSVGIIEDNKVMHSEQPDIDINGSVALKLNGNEVLARGEIPGIAIVNNSAVYEMKGNAVDNGEGPRFMVDKKSVVHDVQ